MDLCSREFDDGSSEEPVDPFDDIQSPTMLQISIGIGDRYTPALAERLFESVDKVLENIGGILGDLMEEHIADVHDLVAIKDQEASAKELNVEPHALMSTSNQIH